MTRGFMTRAGAYLTLFALLVWGVNAVYHRQVLSKYILARTDRAFAQCRGGVEVLFLGDSHAQHGLSTLDIPNSFNFSSQAEHYALNYYKLKSVLAGGPGRLRTVVLPVELHSFAARTLETHYFRDPWYWRRHVDYVEAARMIGDASLAGRMIAACFPFLGNGMDFFHPVDPDKLTPEVRGFVQNRDDFSLRPDRAAVARDRAAGQLSGTNHFDDRLAAYFKRILDLAAHAGLEVILVRMPVTRAYFDEARRFIPSVEGYYETVGGMLAPYDNIVTLDYQASFFGEDGMFWDSDHLNAAGAEYLTLSLWADTLERSLAALPDEAARGRRRGDIAALRFTISELDQRRRYGREAMQIGEMYRAGRKEAAMALAQAAFERGNHDGDILSMMLASAAESGNGTLGTALADAVKTSPIPDKVAFAGGRIVALGLTVDLWTTDGNPAYLAVAAPEDRPDRHEFWLSCDASGDALPITATIDGGGRQVRHTFREPSRVRITLPEVPSGVSRLFVVRADKTWVPPGGKDTRRLGVRIVPVEAGGGPS
ncbi:hypothetical protein [Desulfococcus sp.]|uniref:hypothetical protein n=1 Tax=Desulfococcus sp. TaxID=2025834 RepID=UPI0035944F24